LTIPYDGKDIGEFIGDAIRNFTGGFRFGSASFFFLAADASGIFQATGYSSANNVAGIISAAGMSGNISIAIDASRVVPTADENRPASISVLACISY